MACFADINVSQGSVAMQGAVGFFDIRKLTGESSSEKLF